MSAEVLPVVPARPLEITTLDIRCQVDCCPEIGDPLHVELHDPRFPAACVSGIVHWKSPSPRSQEIGLFLPTGLPDKLLEHRTDSRRESNRYPCHQTGELIRGVEYRAAATAINYSFDGVAIQTAVMCEVASTMTFEWQEEKTIQRLSGRVMWQIRKPAGVLIGCQLTPASGYRIAGLNFTSVTQIPPANLLASRH